jgi:hypothetical protein
MENVMSDVEVQAPTDEIVNDILEVEISEPVNEIEPEAGLEDLKRRLEEERQARFDAEARAKEAADMARKAYNDMEDTNLHLITNAIDTVKRDNDMLKVQLRDSMAVGDYDKASEIQVEISSNSAKLLQLENGKVAMQNKPKQEYAPKANDPVEQFAAQLSPRSADWVRRNPQCVTDSRLHQKMVAAHNLAVADGYIPDSDDYFRVIESTLKINNSHQPARQEQVMSAASAPVQRRSSPAAAPVTRSPGGPGTSPTRIRLTAEEAEFAALNKMTEQEYYNHKQALKKAGKM